MTTTSSRISLTSTFTAPGDARSTRDAVLIHLLRTGMRLVDDAPTELIVDGGSQLVVRLLGLWFAPAHAYPRRVRITFTPTAAGTQVDAEIEEALGFGYLDRRSRRNYLASFRAWLTGLGAALGPAVPMAS